MDEELKLKMERIRAERMRILQEEESVRQEAQIELDSVVAEIEKLEAKREALESFLDIKDDDKRLPRGVVRDLCFDVLRKNPNGLTGSQIKDIIVRENPGLREGSVYSALRLQTSQGFLDRDNMGRYVLVEQD
jgi:hypothetical protein